jgi:predicted N-acetyltransferase YhbS
MITRHLARFEIEQIWAIDRREVIDHIYYFENGQLVLKPEHYEMQGWPPGEQDIYTPLLYDCFDRGGFFYGAFEAGRMIGVVILESKFIGPRHDQLQLKFLHVSQAYRKKGLGKLLFEQAAAQAKAMDAKKLYVSATPSENTINFYLRRGCVVTLEVDPDLFVLEPKDIHLEYKL